MFFDVVGVEDDATLKTRLFREEEELYGAVVRAVRRYTEVQACRRTRTCDEEVIRHLFCGEAFFDSFVAYKLVIRPPFWTRANYDARLDNLFDFARSCLVEGLPPENKPSWERRRSEDWDPVLGKVFAEIDRKWRAASEGAASAAPEGSTAP